MRNIYQEITVHEDETHDYIGMIMMHEIETQQKKIDINDCLESFIEEEPDEKRKPVNIPETNYLFKTREGSVEKILKRKSGYFMQLLQNYFCPYPFSYGKEILVPPLASVSP